MRCCPAPCGKTRHLEAWRAQLAAFSRATLTGRPMRYYWAPDCRVYHITSNIKGRRNKASEYVVYPQP